MQEGYLFESRQGFDSALSKWRHLSSDVDGFSVEIASEWVDAQITDSTLVVSAGENDANSMRSSAITVKAGGLLLEIPIKQVFEATHLSVSSETVVFPKEGGEKTVDVDCDGSYGGEQFVGIYRYGTGKITCPQCHGTGH